jgi:hypothetical protein
MGRKSQRHSPIQPVPSPERRRIHLMDNVLKLPRIVRILIAAVPALALVLVFQPIVDQIYLRLFFSPETINVPGIIIAVMAVLMYFAGWIFIVGYSGEERMPDDRDRRAAFWYLVLSTLIILLGLAYYLVSTLSALSGE